MRASFGLTAGSCSNTSRPAPAMAPAFDQARQLVLVDHLAARGVDDIGRRLQQLQPPRRQQVVRRRRVRAVDGDDVDPRQHLVEALPVGRLQLLLHLLGDAAAVVIVDLQAERLGAASDRLADAAHADDAEPLAVDAVAEHPGRRPAGPVVLGVLQIGAPSASRRGTARISAIVMSAVSSVRTPGVLVTVMPRLRAVSRSMLSTPVPKLAMSRSCGPAWRDHGAVDAVRDGRAPARRRSSAPRRAGPASAARRRR